GKIYIEEKEATGQSLEALRQTRQNIGMIFQGFNLLKTATVYDNVMIPLKLLGLSKKEATERVNKYLDIVGLADRKKNVPGSIIRWTKATCCHCTSARTRAVCLIK